ncbi:MULTISPECIES: phospholipase D-like domain-containing protein [Actinomyces]|uniref:PLDc N-terminal domain-containing protein n=1 Tax=Actinomyces respiraculi TaxID=2744574 RepID=A0A7T0PVE6_9ACTO|nr:MULTISPECIES: phospholipase D-like domain-containing protein [Actinomyces]QPL05226.1 PLDc N-terminal domain-containing protein [Actinomyces respiraculi]
MQLPEFLTTIWVVLEYSIKIAALGTVPENRRPSSSTAWLLLIFLLPVVGLPLYIFLGSPWIHGRRREQQVSVTEGALRMAAGLPDAPAGARPSPHLASVLRMNRRLTALPCVTGEVVALHADAADTYAAMARAIDGAEHHVHVEFYIQSWDEVTDVFYSALERAAARGVPVRLLVDHLGSRKYPGWRTLGRRWEQAGIRWRLMMPLLPHRRRFRRPDLRNHRKLLIVDGRTAFIGSHNIIDPSYRLRSNRRAGRVWHDLSVEVTGDVVIEAQAVFAMDWYFEAGEQLGVLDLAPGLEEQDLADVGNRVGAVVGTPAPRSGRPDAVVNAMQIIPSGPGYPTEPNLRMFLSLIQTAERRVSITSPYFIPDEALLSAITTAAYRGIDVELFVGKESDHFIVNHAQRSYYAALLAAGVRIYRYPAPTVLHAKYMTVDDDVAVIGSSNMDFRSFALNYEVMLLAFGGDLDDLLRGNDEAYRELSEELTAEQWATEPWYRRYVDNVCRLMSAVL